MTNNTLKDLSAMAGSLPEETVGEIDRAVSAKRRATGKGE